MKNKLFIAACFMTIIILELVPYRTKDGETIIFDYNGLLPNLVTFSIICFLFLTVIIVTTIIHLKKTLPGNFILNRLDLNIKSELNGIAFWTAFVVTSMLLAKDFLYFFKGTASYFFIVIFGVLLYDLTLKWLVKHNRPNYLSVNNDLIYLKNFFSRGNRKIQNLKMVSYDKKQNAIIFSFQEGLDNFKLYLTDFDLIEIHNLINKIKKTKGDENIVDENFNKHFNLSI